MSRAYLPFVVVGALMGSAVIGQQLDAVTAALKPRLEQSGRKTVAVVDFTDLQGQATELGRYLAEELSVSLAMSLRGITVIDRTHLKALLQEHRLGASGVIDPQTARQLGKIAGVDTLITGTLTELGDNVRLSVKALDSQTAGLVAATASDVPKTDAIKQLLGRSVGAGGARTDPPSKLGQPSAQQTARGAGVVIELQACERSGICRLFVTAEKDGRLMLNPVRAWDDSGNQYPGRSVSIGNRNWDAEVVGGVRTPVVVTFEYSNVTSLAVVELGVNSGFGVDATLRFRNVVLR